MRVLLLFILPGLLAGCAKVGSPAGGPVDRTPPGIAGHRPSADAVGVALDHQVEILFSEPMDRERTEEAVFVSPGGRLRFGWRGRRLVLDLDLKSDRTYVVTVGTGARDLRRNALEQSFTFAFATGDQLNQGRVRGYVFRDHEPARAAHVWAYDLRRFEGRVGVDLPDYQTQSGQDGAYAFSRLSEGTFRLLAFVDENRNQRFDPGEFLALPAGDLPVAEGPEVEAGHLALVQAGPAAAQLQRVQAVHHCQLLLLFEAEVDPKAVKVELKGLAIEGVYGSAQDGRKVYLRTAPQEKGRAYPFVSLKVGDQSIKWKEAVRGSGRSDRTPPALVHFFPQKNQDMVPGDSLQLVFGEAMQPIDLADFWIASDSTRTPAGTWHWPGRGTLVFVPDPALEPGPYQLQGRGHLLQDLAGLALKDSLVEFEFEVLAPEDLAQLRGRAKGGDTIRVVAQHQKQERVYQARADSAGHYDLEGLLPGPYTVWGFVDQNGNGRPDPGVLEPFAPAEPYCRFTGKVTLTPGTVAEDIDLEFR